jgi:RNA polymerase sigma factor (sigma-70 family)
LRLLRAADERDIANPEAYLFTVARNLLTEHSVSEQRQAAGSAHRSASADEGPFLEVDFDGEIDQSVQLEKLRGIVLGLPDPQRAAILMAYRDDMSYSEIAHELNVHRSMVGKYMIQALNACRKRLKSREPR